MKRPVAAFLAVCLMLPAVAVEITLSPDEEQACDQEGGCFVITRQRARTLMEQAFQMGVNKGQEKCTI